MHFIRCLFLDLMLTSLYVYCSNMHAVAGIHSAMAIKRQRHRREVAARERERRLRYGMVSI